MTGFVQGPPADSVRAVLRDIFASNDYEWSLQRSLWTWVTRAWRDLVSFMARLAAEHPVAWWVLMAVLLLILALLFTHMALVIRRALRPLPPAPHPSTGISTAHDSLWHRRMARTLAAAGRYPEALGHRFSALVLELESRRIVTVRPSRTPAEYAREVRFDGDGRAAFSLLVQTLYAVIFGGRAAGADDYAAFERDAEALVHRAPAR